MERLRVSVCAPTAPRRGWVKTLQMCCMVALAALLISAVARGQTLPSQEAAAVAAAPAVPAAATVAPAVADTGSTAWMLMSSALVLFMMPGLALFYGGMVRRKNVLAT